MLNRQLLILFFLAFTFSLNAQDYEPENMGPRINNPKQTDSSPVISPDGKFFFHMRDGGKGGHDIVYSELLPDGTWSESVPVEEFNNELRNYPYCITPDGNTIYIEGTYGSTPSRDGVSKSTRTANGWSKPESIVFESVPKPWGDQSASLSLDGKKMILGLNRDVYISFLGENNVWSTPVPLPNLNTDGAEYSPLLASDDKTIYFSSDGMGGYGNNDIYKTTRLDDTWMNWSKPQNMGNTINTPSFESYFTISAKGDYAYVYSLKEGSGDLFRIPLKNELKPQSVVLISGKVYNQKTKELIQASIHYEVLPDAADAGTATTKPNEGSYNIILPYGKHYGYHARAEGYLGLNENLDLSEVSAYKEITQDLYLVPIEVGQSLKLNNVFFVQGKAELLPSSYPELDRLAKILNENSSIEIEVGGHTDNIGDPGLLLKLSDDRVKAVKAYLVSKQVKENRIQGKGYGGTKPVASNASEETRRQNRRVEFTILKK